MTRVLVTVLSIFLFASCVSSSPAIVHTDIHEEREIDDEPMRQQMPRPEMQPARVESKPVIVKVKPESMTGTKPTMKPLRTRVVVVHNNMVPVPIECFQPPDSGACGKDMVRVYYDHETRTCKPFSYTGCGGNANRFLSVKNCYRICHPYRYQVKPVVANVKKPVLMAPKPQPAPMRNPAPSGKGRLIHRDVKSHVHPNVPAKHGSHSHGGGAPQMAPQHQQQQQQQPQSNMAMVPVSSYQSVPIVQSVPIMRSGYMAVPVNNYGGMTMSGMNGMGGGGMGYGGYGRR